MGWLVGVYVAASVFGVGITLVDLLGLLGHGGGHDAGTHAGHDSHDGGGEHAGQDHAGHPAGSNGTQPASILSSDPRPPRFELGLRSLAAARTLVYFAFGFGPLGWIATAFGTPPLTSLLWSVPTGVVFAGVGLALRRLQRTVLDSQVREEELLMETAEIIVPIEPGKVGKARILVGGRYVERYAKARDPLASLVRGERVRVVDMDGDGVIVEY